MPDPTSVGAPDTALLARIANAMFREVTQGVALPGGIPSGTGTSLGGFGAALPSAPLPESPLPSVAVPGAIPSGPDASPSGLGVPAPATKPPAPASGALGGFGTALPSTPLPEPAALSVGAVPGAFPSGPDASLSGLEVPEMPPASLQGLAAPGGVPSSTGTALVGFGAPLPPGPLPEPVMPGVALPDGIPSVPSTSVGGFEASRPATVLPELPPLGLDIPGEAELRVLLAAASMSPSSVPTGPTPYYYFLQQPPAAMGSSDGFDVNFVRRDFPILSERVNGRPLIWLDNAATTQKPQAVIDRLSYYYEHENSNVHRAAHELAARATDAYETARETVRRFINAGSADEIVFVRGTTEAINLISNTWGRRFIGKDDEIVITWLEHHANIVPWQMLCEQTGAILKVAPVDESGQVKLDEYGKLLGPRTKLVSFTHVSNALGTVTPAKLMTEMAHAAGARVLLDGAQSVSHMRSDVRALDVDWFVFSGHKVFGPTGIGAVYGKPEILAESPPWQGGGNMIADVTFERTEYKLPPSRFEAGTGNIADAVGLGAALEYVERVGIEAIGRHEHDLLAYATRLLLDIPGLHVIGTAREKTAVISFVLDGIETTGVGGLLNEDGIAVRAGHHCAQPILRRFGVENTVRVSLALYNTYNELDALAAAVRRIQSKQAPHRLA